MTAYRDIRPLLALLVRREHREYWPQEQRMLMGLPRHLECHRVWPDQMPELVQKIEVRWQPGHQN